MRAWNSVFRIGWLCIGFGVCAGPASGQGLSLLSDLQDRYPTWDPSRERVWFYSNRAGIEELWSVRPDGTDPVRWPGDGHREVVPSAGRDGRVVYVRYVGENEEIFLLDPDTGARMAVSPDPAGDSDPSWAPDGRIWFSSNRGGSWSIWSVDVDGGDLRQETDAPQRDALPQVSPDGRWLAFQRTLAPADAEVFLRDLETGEEWNASNWSDGWDGWPSWAPDSRSILFSSNRGGEAQLWAVGVQRGDTARAVTALPGVRVRRAHWLPGGRRILTNLERPGDPTVLTAILGESVLRMTAEEAGGPPSDAPDPEALVSLAEALVGQGRVAGAEIYVERAGEVLLHEARGWADLERGVRLTSGRPHNLRSLTKPVGGTLAQVLIDRGVLSATDRVADHLPSFRGEPTDAITIEDLLTHRAGYEQGPPGAPWSTFRSVGELAEVWGARGPSLPVRGAWSYADAHADILGAVLEAASGVSIERLLQEEVLRPLGMAETFRWDGGRDPRAEQILPLHQGSTGAWSVTWRPEDGPFYSYPMLSQSLHGTADDYADFLRAWTDALNGRPSLVSLAAAQRAFANRAPITVPAALFPLAEGFAVTYGHMWGAFFEPDAGPGDRPYVVTHAGSDGTFAWAFPELELIVLFFTQSRGQDIQSDVERTLRDRIVAPMRAGGLGSG